MFSPLLMTFLLTLDSGKPIAEERMRETRPRLRRLRRAHQRLLPLPPRSAART